MTVIIPFCLKDAYAARVLAELLATRCNMERHRLLMYADSKENVPTAEWGAKLGVPVEALHGRGIPMTYPQGPNDMIASLARELAGPFGEKHPRIFLAEADAFPLCPDALDRIEAAHVALGRRVSGCRVDWLDHTIDAPDHLNGNLVMDSSFAKDHPVLARRVWSAWDCHHAELLLSEGADNPEIWLPARVDRIMPTQWWLSATRPDGHRPAWVHGCRGMAVLDHLTREGFDDTKHTN